MCYFSLQAATSYKFLSARIAKGYWLIAGNNDNKKIV